MHVVGGVCGLSCCVVHDSDAMKNGEDLKVGASVLKFKVRTRAVCFRLSRHTTDGLF